MIRVVVFLSRYDARQTRRAQKDATLPQTKPRARLDDARDELDERVLGGVVFTPRVLLVRVPVLARARPSNRFVGARGTTERARVRVGLCARPRELAGRPRAPSGASCDRHRDERRRRAVTATTTATPDRVARRSAARVSSAWWTLSENKVSSAPREISPNSRSPSSPSWWDSPSAPSSRTRRVRRMPSYRSPSYSSPSLYPASCTAAITRAASYDGFATAIGYRRC